MLLDKSMSALTNLEFQATFREPMSDVTAAPGDVIDIWPYVTGVATEEGFSTHVLREKSVEYVARSSDGIFNQVALPTEKKNKYLVIVVDRTRREVHGHHILDLNREYRLE